MEILSFTLNGVAPICLSVLVGMLLKKIGVISEKTAQGINKLCFTWLIPCNIFITIYNSDLTASLQPVILFYPLIATLVVIAILWMVVPKFVKNRAQCGEFIQGTFRSNASVLGLPLILNLYGQDAGAVFALPLPLMIIAYNIIAPVVLSYFSGGKEVNYKEIAKKIITNPFLVSALLGVLFNVAKIPLPVFFTKTLSQFSASGSPVALIALGAMTNFESFKNSGKLAFISSVLRLVIIPLIVIPIAVLLGFRGASMGVIICFFSTPTAIGSYVLAKNITGDGELAGQILLQTTVLSFITMFVTIFALRALGIM